MSTATKATGNGRIDVEVHRERVAGAVGLAVSELIGDTRDDRQTLMKRMVASYFLYKQDQLLIDDIARVMAKNDRWVRESRDYIERRISHYYAFRVYIDKEMATYALASS